MRILAAVIALTAALAVSAPATAKTQLCRGYSYSSGQALKVFASTPSLCKVARKNAAALYARRRCPRGWRYVRLKPSPIGVCKRGKLSFFAARVPMRR